MLDTACINMQIDIGFGDIVHPGPESSELPTMLGGPAPRLFCYSRESAIAEKLEAMIKLGELNSRMNDFYDIWLLSRQFDFDGTTLAEAIRQTLRHRVTELSEEIVAFSDRFAVGKQVQWSAFRRRLMSDTVPVEFGEVVSSIRDFLAPIIDALRAGLPFIFRWTAPGPWRP